MITVATSAGGPVHEITLQDAGGTTAQVRTLGAVLQTLEVPMPGGRRQPVILSAATTLDPARGGYLGAIVGRYANRIAGGRFTLDGVPHDLDRNEADITTLHGGSGGFSQRLWTVGDHGPAHVTLHLTSPDGDQGFPGTVRATCRYALGPGPCLTIDLTATTDRATPVSLTAHPYFNLDGTPDLTHHRLQVLADHYTPLNATGTPTGQIAPVGGTPFDFRIARPVTGAGAIDHNLCLGPASDTPRPVATLHSVASGLTMTLATTAPGLQVYDGAYLDGTGADGRHLGPHAGLCLEPQHYPDAPNIAAFPDAILRPGATWRQCIVLTFAAQTAP